ncbi:MAG: hypothetical protein V4616_02830 [Bacteroidota bacterium]
MKARLIFILFIALLGLAGCQSSLVPGNGRADEARLLELKTRIYATIAAGQTDSVIYYVLESDRYDYQQYPEIGISINRAIAEFFRQRQAYNQALKYQQKQLFLHEHAGGNKEAYVHLFCLGSIQNTYLKLGKMDSAEVYCQKTLDFAIDKKDLFYLLHAYNNFGYFRLSQHKYREAIGYFNKALSQPGQPDTRAEKVMAGVITGNLGMCYLHLGDYARAKTYIDANLASSRSQGEYSDVVTTVPVSAQIFIQLGRPEEAIRVLDSGEKYAAANRVTFSKEEYYREYYRANRLLGNQQGFAHYLGLYEKEVLNKFTQQQQALDEALTNLTDQRVARLELEKERQEQEARKSAELASLRFQRLIGILLITLILIVSLVLFYRRKNRESQRKAELEKAQKELLEAELRNQELEKARLNIELRNRELEEVRLNAELQSSQKDLTNLAMDLNYHEEVKKTLVHKLKKVRKDQDAGNVNVVVNEILNDLNLMWQDGQSRALFNENISKVNDAFFGRLKERFPLLSKGELEFCGLIRLKIGTKEIATLKNISVESVKMTRYRVRKKLQLSGDSDMYRFMEEI